ncbi:Protein arginine N-methyltransferase 8 [Paramecium bursaria]
MKFELGHQEDILKESIRIEPFLDCIRKNKHLFKGKVVLEIDCGTALLSIHASRVGASQVYATGASDITKQIVQDNQIDNITLFDQPLQKIENLPKVDIIICCWMGSMLLYDSKIKDVIYARDQCLNAGGIIFPDHGSIYVQSIEDEQYRRQKLQFWDQVYGVDMQAMKRWVQIEPLFESIKPSQLNGDPSLIYEIDMYTCTESDLQFANAYKIRINRTDYISGIIAWFEYAFNQCHLPLNISMAPTKEKKFWKPAIFYLKEEIPVNKNDRLQGTFAFKLSKEQADIKISFHLQNKIQKLQQINSYRIN